MLDDGVLAYYKSAEEVGQGCKGSLKVSACEISVSQVDPLRLDVTLPGEQHFYLRASTSQERQQWLVALGSAKACDRLTTQESEPGLMISHFCYYKLRSLFKTNYSSSPQKNEIT